MRLSAGGRDGHVSLLVGRALNAVQTSRVPAVSVVIPVFRSAETLESLVRRIRESLDSSRIEWELLLIDDGSPDESWEVLEALRRSDEARISIFRLSRNFGQHNALMCGFRAARGESIVTLDDDLQNPPEEIPRLLQRLEADDLDVVYGRPAAKRHRRWRNLGSLLVNSFYRRAFGTGVDLSAFRAIRRRALIPILDYDLNFTFVDGLLAWSTQSIGEVEVAHFARSAGRSGYSLRRLVGLAFNLFTNFSLLPLRLATLAGVSLALVGFAIGLWYFVAFLGGQITVPGYASTITAIFVLGGAQLVGLGVIGEYLGRLHHNINRKPQYAIRAKSGPAS